MAVEKPQLRGDVELCQHMALAMRATIARDIGDPVHHQHRGLRKLRVAGAKQLSARAFQQGVPVKACWKIRHSVPLPRMMLFLFASALALRQRLTQGCRHRLSWEFHLKSRD